MRVITEAKVVDGAYVLAPTDDWAGATLRAGDVISPGSSIGGWAVVAVSAHGARVRRITAREKGEIRAGARPPGEGPTEWLPTGAVRWALSAGAARRGLAHRHRVPADPIERWRLSVGLPREAVRRMHADEPLSVSDGGRNVRSAATGHGAWPVELRTDGAIEVLATQEGPEFRGPCGPELKWWTRDLRVTGATWAILREARWRCSGPPERVWIWPGGDAAALAALGA